MPSVVLTGILKGPTGNVLANYDIKLIALRTSDAVIGTSEAITRSDSNGNYSITVLYGTYAIKLKSAREAEFKTVASNILISSASFDGKSLEYVIGVNAVTDNIDQNLVDQALEISTGVLQYKDDAASSAASAASSAASAESSAISADTSKDAAASSAVAAASSATAAASSATSASTSAASASTSKDASAANATSAASSATSSANSATSAASSATSAASSAIAAADSAADAALSAVSVSNAFIDSGSIDLTITNPPIPVKDSNNNNLSTIWRVSGAGTLNAVSYSVGDQIAYSKVLDSFYKIDNTDIITSVNGMTGVVTITNITGNAGTASKLETARSISSTGDAIWTVSFDGSAAASGILTLTNSGVTAGTYNNTSTTVTPFTVDAKGRVTSTGTAVTITPAWSSITSKPTTLSGYAITDAQPLNNNLTSIGLLSTASTGLLKLTNGVASLDTNTYLTGNQTITATGDATGSGTTSIALTLANSGVIAGTYSNVTVDAKGRATSGNNAPTISGGSINGTPIGATTASTVRATTLTTTGDANIAGNLVLTGNLTINGTTTTVNSLTVTVDDPILTLGGDTAPTSDDAKDRGIEYRWHNGTTSKVGFFGFDRSTGYLTFIPDATNTSEVFSGTVGSINANLVGNADTATKLAAARSISITGDATWTTTFDGSAASTGVLTLANSGVVAGTYNDINTSVRPFTVDAKGRITSVGTAVTITPAWSNVTGKPTTVAGLSLTDFTGLSSTNPLVNGTAAIGTATTAAKADHVHPTDTSRAPLASPTFTGTVTAPTFAGTLSGNASTATKLATAATISASGDANWSVLFDGSATATATLTLVTTGVTAGTYNNDGTTVRPFTVDSKGRITSVGTTVTIAPAWSSITSKPTTISGLALTDLTGLSSTLPIIDGVATVGTSTTVARADHIHPTDTTRSPLAGSTSIVTLGTVTTGTWNAGNVTVNGALAVTGNTTLTGDIAINGGDLTTTSTTANIFTSTATTLNLGGSTATSTVNISTGATISGSTKVINIGTSGVSGSTTSINLGSSTSSGSITLNQDTIINSTGYLTLPDGTTAQRPSSPVNGMMRYNTDNASFEGYANGQWGDVGGGGGAQASGAIYENSNTITASYSITAGKNGMSAGPITIADGVTISIPDGSVWVII